MIHGTRFGRYRALCAAFTSRIAASAGRRGRSFRKCWDLRKSPFFPVGHVPHPGAAIFDPGARDSVHCAVDHLSTVCGEKGPGDPEIHGGVCLNGSRPGELVGLASSRSMSHLRLRVAIIGFCIRRNLMKRLTLLFLAAVWCSGCGQSDDPTAHNTDQPDPEGDAIRQQSLQTLSKGGFQAADWLPTADHRAGVPGKLRPVREIALRLMALDALFTWASAPEDAVATDRLKAYIDRNDLRAHLTEDERAMLSLSRKAAREQHSAVVGWRLENMWALAWVLGFETPPDPMLGQIPSDVSRAVILEFLPGLDASVDDLLKKAKPRTQQEVVALEDVFYCSHNAVRSAQTGSKTSVPSNFDPIGDGGAIHERRHSLTWTISPGVEWDDTDLST